MIATVSDNGIVTAVNHGTAMITASMIYKGVEYSDTAAVEVVASAEYVDGLFFEPGGESSFLRLDYTDNGRNRYVVPDFENRECALVFNPGGTSTKWYADWRMAPLQQEQIRELFSEMPENPPKLVVEASGVPSSLYGEISMLVQPSSENNQITAVDDPIYIDNGVYEYDLIPTLDDLDALVQPRMMTIQINDGGGSLAEDVFSVKLKLRIKKPSS